MIELKSLLLCDAATVREGLLHILGGGITTIWRTSYPDALMASVACTFEVSGRVGSDGEDHAFKLVAYRVVEDGEFIPLFEAGADIHVESEGSTDSSRQTLPIVINLSNAGVSSPGDYRIDAYMDDARVGAISFEARIASNVAPEPFA